MPLRLSTIGLTWLNKILTCVLNCAWTLLLIRSISRNVSSFPCRTSKSCHTFQNAGVVCKKDKKIRKRTDFWKGTKYVYKPVDQPAVKRACKQPLHGQFPLIYAQGQRIGRTFPCRDITQRTKMVRITQRSADQIVHCKTNLSLLWSEQSPFPMDNSLISCTP